MGALHEGHLSLIRAARSENDYVVVSIFVNPTQFGQDEDFMRYPRPFESDAAKCRTEKVDQIFYPEPSTLYPDGFRTYVEVEGWQELLCGASRPGHFRGVTTVVMKLFNIVQPDRAYFGQKDAQQARIIQKMVQDLDVPVEIRVAAIVREVDGLALSSRNQYLLPEQRRHATVLYHALHEACELIDGGERDGPLLARKMQGRIEATPGAKLDYAAVIDLDTLQPIERLHGRVLLAVAA